MSWMWSFSVTAADLELADLLEWNQQIQHDVHLHGDLAADSAACAVAAAAGRGLAGTAGLSAVHRATRPPQARLQRPVTGMWWNSSKLWCDSALAMLNYSGTQL